VKLDVPLISEAVESVKNANGSSITSEPVDTPRQAAFLVGAAV
jgi:hypothetical protein